MKYLKFKYIKIIFKHGSMAEFFNSNIEHIESHANNEYFVVKIYYNSNDLIKSHSEEYLYNIKSIKSVEQRWDYVGDEDNEIL